MFGVGTVKPSSILPYTQIKCNRCYSKSQGDTAELWFGLIIFTLSEYGNGKCVHEENPYFSLICHIYCKQMVLYQHYEHLECGS
jgi:hypothetical protein